MTPNSKNLTDEEMADQLATDIKEVRGDQRLRLVSTTELGYQGMTLNVAKGEASKNPLGQDARVHGAALPAAGAASCSPRSA